MKFISIDGDNVGQQIEYYILINDLDSLISYISRFNLELKKFVANMVDRLNAEIIFTGGDNCLLKVDNGINFDAIKMYSKMFTDMSNKTLSIGIGSTPRDAYLALKFAKASGKNKIIIMNEGRLLNV